MVQDKAEAYRYINSINWQQEKTPCHWYRDQPFVTHFFNALSLGIPESERFVVRVLKHYVEDLTSPLLKQAVQEFIEEENTHSLQHTKFNRDLKRHKYPVKFALSFARFGYKAIDKLFPMKVKLAMTVCLEHLTTVISSWGLGLGLMQEKKCAVYDLFFWHAKEELNHRVITMEAYTALGGGYIIRILSMIYITTIFVFGIFVIQWSLILKDLTARRANKWQNFKTMWLFYWGKQGLFRLSWRHYRVFYNKDFCP